MVAHLAYPGGVERPHNDVDGSEVNVVRNTPSVVDVARQEVQYPVRYLLVFPPRINRAS